MIKETWIISIILLCNLLRFSQEYAIDTQFEQIGRRNFQSKDMTGVMPLTQDCIQVCNNFDCLFLCPHPNRGVKRCATQLKSKICCQNNQKESAPLSDNLKVLNKLQQARVQYLGFIKDLENEIANKRLSIIRNLQPIVNKQNNSPSNLLQMLEPKSVKLKADIYNSTTDKNASRRLNNILRKNDSTVKEKLIENNENSPQPAVGQKKADTNLDTEQFSLNLLAHAIQNKHTLSEMLESSTGIAPELNTISGNLDKADENILGLKSDTSHLSVSTNSFLNDSPVSKHQETIVVPNYTTLEKWLGYESYNASHESKNSTSPDSDTYDKDYKGTSIDNGEYSTEATSHDYLKSDSFIYYTDLYPENKIGSLKSENLVMANHEDHYQYTTPLTFTASYSIPNSALNKRTENSEVINFTAGKSFSEIIETANNENELRPKENVMTSESPKSVSRFLYTTPSTFTGSLTVTGNPSNDLLNQKNYMLINNSLQFDPETIKESEFETEINDIGLTKEDISTENPNTTTDNFRYTTPLALTDSFDSTPKFSYLKSAENEVVNLTPAEPDSGRLSLLESPLLADPEPIMEKKITKELTELSVIKIILTSETPTASKQNQLNNGLNKEGLVENYLHNDNKSYPEKFQNTFSTYSDIQNVGKTTSSKQNQLNNGFSTEGLVENYLHNDNKDYYTEFLNVFRSYYGGSDAQKIEETSGINDASGSSQNTLAYTVSLQDNESSKSPINNTFSNKEQENNIPNENFDENLELDKRSTDGNQNKMLQLDEIRIESEPNDQIPIQNEINMKKNDEIHSERMSYKLNRQTILPTLVVTNNVLNSLNYTQLEESKENDDGNISSNSSYKQEKQTENPLKSSPSQNDIEANAVSRDKEEVNITTESTLSDVINYEMNNMDQKKIVLKKREGEMPSNENVECECNDQAEESIKKSYDNTLYSPNYNIMNPYNPLFLYIASPYPLHNFGNQKIHTGQNGNMFLGESNVYTGAILHHLPSYPMIPYNNWQYVQQDNIVPVPLINPYYLPQPWQSNLEPSQPIITDESMGPITDHPSSQEITQTKLENSLQEKTSTPMTLNDEELDTSTPMTQNEKTDFSTPMILNNRELTTPIPTDVLKMYEALISSVIAKMPKTKRTGRNDKKQNGSFEYVFESGQYVKLQHDTGEDINRQDRADGIVLATTADRLMEPAIEQALPETERNHDNVIAGEIPGQVVEVPPNEIPSSSLDVKSY